MKINGWYFGAVCLGIASVGLLLLLFAAAYPAHAQAATQGSWSLDGSGNITSISTATDSAYYFIGSSLNPNSGSFPVCYGGTSGTGAINSTGFVGLNVFSAGGLNTSSGPPSFSGDCRPAGNYYFVLTHGPYTSGDVSTYYELYWNGTNAITVNPSVGSSTSISLIEPTQGTTTASTTLQLQATYNIGTDLAHFSIDGSLPQQIGIQFFIQNVGTGQQTTIGPDFSIASSTGSFGYSTTTTLAAGDYSVVAQLVGDYGSFSPPPGCTPILPFQTCTGGENVNILVSSLPPATFSLDNGTFPLLGFQVGSTSSRNGLATTTCDALHIGGCFQNALAFLFYPNPNDFDSFGNLWTSIQNKPPFGYVSQTIAQLSTLNASSTAAFSFGNLPLTAEIFTPLRTGIAALLWLGWAIVFYRGRLRHLDI